MIEEDLELNEKREEITKNMSCEFCLYNMDNQCYRYPPTPIMWNIHNNVKGNLWPDIKDYNFCGEFKPVKYKEQTND